MLSEGPWLCEWPTAGKAGCGLWGTPLLDRQPGWQVLLHRCDSYTVCGLLCLPCYPATFVCMPPYICYIRLGVSEHRFLCCPLVVMCSVLADCCSHPAAGPQTSEVCRCGCHVSCAWSGGCALAAARRLATHVSMFSPHLGPAAWSIQECGVCSFCWLAGLSTTGGVWGVLAVGWSAAGTACRSVWG